MVVDELAEVTIAELGWPPPMGDKVEVEAIKRSLSFIDDDDDE